MLQVLDSIPISVISFMAVVLAAYFWLRTPAEPPVPLDNPEARRAGKERAAALADDSRTRAEMVALTRRNWR